MELDISDSGATGQVANPRRRSRDRGLELVPRPSPVEEPPAPCDDLESALVRARRGEEQGITSLFRMLQPLLLRYLRHHAPAVAEDLASEVWIATSQQLTRFDGDADDLRAWMFTVARRRVVDYYRRSSRQPVTNVLDDSHEYSLPTDIAAGVVDAMSAQEAVESLVRILSADQAEVILLRVVADLSVEHVATLMGRSPGSIRVLQHRALRRLSMRWKTVVTQ